MGGAVAERSKALQERENKQKSKDPRFAPRPGQNFKKNLRPKYLSKLSQSFSFMDFCQHLSKQSSSIRLSKDFNFFDPKSSSKH